MADDPMTANVRRAASFERDGRFFEAESLYRQLAQLKPPHPMSHYLYGNFKLLTGDFEGAWPLFQMRLKDPFYLKKGTMQLPQPWWDGAEIKDKTLFVHVDQGIGDAILCARFLPQAADRVGRLILAAHKGLGRFFKGFDPRIETVEIGDPWPVFDVHVDLFSLPAIFGAGPGAMPSPPYLAAEPALAKRWRKRLDGLGLKVGLAWQGNPQNPRDEEKSIPFKEMKPILAVPGARFFGLQVGHGADQAKRPPKGVDFTPLGEELGAARHGMIDTAAVIANLDLVISVDSAVAHLTAAMARPLWVLVYMVPDWRWMIAGETRPPRFEVGPWYPRARPFRQQTRWQWRPVIKEAAAELKKLAAGKSPA